MAKPRVVRNPRIVIVTGGASGIGKAVCAALVRLGDTVVVADINGEAAVRAVAAMTGAGHAVPATLDVTDAEAVRDLVDSVADQYGRLDLMANNAGIGLGGFVEELDVEHWNRVIDVNIRGVVHGVAAAYPLMVRQGHGHLVNTASLAGLVPSPGLTPYSMTKHAVVGLSTSLRVEGAALGVRVTAVCPGFTDTPILDAPTPSGLRPTSTSGRGREVAEKFPGGLYNVDALADVIVEGIDRNKRLIVAPKFARVAHLANRVMPAVVERQVRDRLSAARPSLMSN